MKKFRWLQLIALNALVILCIFLPFIPGRYDQLSYIISGIAQVIGILGLLLIPFGTLWLIREIKKNAGSNKPLNNWSNGYYYALTATYLSTLFCLFFALALLISVGPSAGVVSIVAIAYTLYRLIPKIRNLKNANNKSFNATPLYLLSIPIIAFAVRFFFISPASDNSRNYAIKQGEKLISIIENYYVEKGNYPESLDNVYMDIPKPSVMGIDKFLYERNRRGYNLSFVQWQHFGATREVVMYNKNDEHNVKGHFASHNVKHPHWRYYWLD